MRVNQQYDLGLATLLVTVCLYAAPVEAIAGNHDSETNATFGEPLVSDPVPEKPGEMVDHGDYYWLSNGKRARFLRRRNTYVVLPKRDRSSAATIRRNIESRFGTQLSILKPGLLRRQVMLRIPEGRAPRPILRAIRNSDPAISFISPLLTDPSGDAQIAALPRVIVKLRKSAEYDRRVARLSTGFGLTLSARLKNTDREFEFTMTNTVEEVGEIFELSRRISALSYVEWSEPVMVAEPKYSFSPDDPLYINQWHLHNVGQNGALPEADINAENGWEISRGNGSVIAVFDDGVQTSHPDLDIWSNPGESGDGKESNGIDDDGNSYVDDHQGWDFADNDNNPDPGSSDNHGTAVAGIAGAVGNNSLGVVGSAADAGILPVRSGSMTCTDWGNAMRYAGKHADVVSNSWGIGGCENALDSAIADVVNGLIPGARRGSKGTPVLFAAGNSASGWRRFTLSGFPVGSYTFRWEFNKDGSVSSGYDTIWLDDISWPGGATTNFESDAVGAIPFEFNSVTTCDGVSNAGNWTVVSDGIHARGASGNAVKAVEVGDSQTTCLQTFKAVDAGSLVFWAWVSSEQNFDFFKFYVNNTLYFQYAPGQYGHVNKVGYPASNPDTIAVGGSGDGAISGLEERTHYSQFGPEIDVVAPASGANQGITTTDRTGGSGYSSSDYTTSFGGTSAATPLVAGIVADIISFAPSLTESQIRTALQMGAEPIGPYPYSGVGNDFYGHGRVDLLQTLQYVEGTAPTRVVVRSEAAKAILEAKGVTPTGGAMGIFEDIATTDFNAGWIEELYSLGIAEPCYQDELDLYFCPDMVFDKTQAARILLRANAPDPATYAPDPAGNSTFDDVDIGAPFVAGDGDFAADWIVEFGNLGFAEGCDANNYCPGEAITWETLNTMLGRVFP